MKNGVKALPVPAGIKVFGKTFPLKDKLKQIGFSWDYDHWSLEVTSPQHLSQVLNQLKDLGVDVSDVEKPLGRFIIMQGLAQRKVAVDWLTKQGLPQPTEVSLFNLCGRLEVNFRLPRLGKDQFKQVLNLVKQLKGDYDGGWFKLQLPEEVRDLIYTIADITRVDPDLPLRNPTPDDIINAAQQYIQYWRSKASSS